MSPSLDVSVSFFKFHFTKMFQCGCERLENIFWYLINKKREQVYHDEPIHRIP